MQSVKIGGTLSKWGAVHVNVPQGSILGLCCFLFTLTYCWVYADDTLLHCCGTDLVVVQEPFQQDVDRVQDWMQSNRLQLDVAKSALMLIGSCQKLKDHNVSILIGGRPLPRVISTKYLGVIIDQHLTWQCHIFKKIRTKLFASFKTFT